MIYLVFFLFFWNVDCFSASNSFDASCECSLTESVEEIYIGDLLSQANDDKLFFEVIRKKVKEREKKYKENFEALSFYMEVDLLNSFITLLTGSQQIDINYQDKKGQTLLCLALKQEKDDFVEAIIKIKGNEIDFFAKDAHENSYLHYVVFYNHTVDRVRFFLEKIGSDQKNISDLTPLHYATSGQKLDVVELLLIFGADVHHRNREGFTALSYACDDRILKLLLKRGARILDSFHPLSVRSLTPDPK